MTSSPTYRGFVSAIGLGQLVSWGTLYYSFPLIAEAMAKDMGWNRADIYGAATLGLLASALATYPVGTLIDRGHGRKVMVGATLASCVLFASWSFVTSMSALYVVVIALGALQAACLYEPAFAVAVRQLGAQHSRAAITSITLWAGFASTVFIPIVQWMLDGLGWRGALMGVAVANLLVAAPAYLWAIRTSSVTIEDELAISNVQPSSIQPVLRTPRFFLLTAAFCAYMALFSGFTYHIYPLLIAKGADTQSVVFAIALIGPSQVAARVLLLMFKEISIRRLGLLVSVVFPVVILMLIEPPSSLNFAAMCILYGSANGIFTIVRGMAVPELISRRNYGRLNGIMLVPMSIARAIAPWALAAAWAGSGNVNASIYLLLGLSVLVPLLLGLAVSSRAPNGNLE